MKLLQASKLGREILEVLGLPWSGVSRIQLDIDMADAGRPAMITITSAINWKMTEAEPPSVKEVVARYFGKEAEATVEEPAE